MKLIVNRQFLGAVLFVSLFAALTAHAQNQIKVLEFNVWAVPVPGVSKNTDERFESIPKAIADTGADIVVIAEAWRDYRKTQLIDGLKALGYPYSFYQKPERDWIDAARARGALGNGLLVISKFPLTHSKTMKFSDYTRYDEFPTFKGALYTQVTTPQNGEVDLFVTHLGAFTTETIEVGERDIPDHFNSDHMASKFQQALELRSFVYVNRIHRTMILVGDLNTHPLQFIDGKYDTNKVSDVYHLMTCAGATATHCLGLVDTFAVTNDETTTRPFTYDTEINTYARGGVFASEPPGRIDYIFVNAEGALQPMKSEVVFNQTPALSDHFGLMTTFQGK